MFFVFQCLFLICFWLLFFVFVFLLFLLALFLFFVLMFFCFCFLCLPNCKGIAGGGATSPASSIMETWNEPDTLLGFNAPQK